MTYYEAYIHLLDGTGGAEAHEKAVEACREMALMEDLKDAKEFMGNSDKTGCDKDKD